ncbi:MAG: DUF3667 domain-containing protein [Flavobacteriaceae bacterium]|nr:DUF3667 domain-containing protein [Flavobacteriaceae bacterium]
MKCKNCKINLLDDDMFCHVCGAKVIRNKLTLKNLWNDFSEQFLNYDNRLLKTYFGIFLRPAETIGAYISGTRKKYVNVVSYFALAITLIGIQIFIIRKFYPEALDISVILPDSAVNESMTDIDWIYDYMSIFALLNIPLYGLIAKLTFVGLKKFNYTEHVVIQTYIQAQFNITSSIFITLLVALFGWNYYILGYISIFIMMIFTSYTYKKLYPLKLSSLFLRLLLFFGIIILTSIVMVIVQLTISIMLAGGFEEFFLEVKEQQGVSYITSSVINWTS